MKVHKRDAHLKPVTQKRKKKDTKQSFIKNKKKKEKEKPRMKERWAKWKKNAIHKTASLSFFPITAFSIFDVVDMSFQI